jgi:hypothetical protein
VQVWVSLLIQELHNASFLAGKLSPEVLQYLAMYLLLLLLALELAMEMGSTVL